MQTFYLKEFLKSNLKFQKPEDLLKHLDAILDLAKDDVKRIAYAKNKYFADFEKVYQLACDATKLTLSKVHLSAIKRILSCGDLGKVASWLIAHLLNNMHNLTGDNRYKQGLDMRGISLTYDEDKFF